MSRRKDVDSMVPKMMSKFAREWNRTHDRKAAIAAAEMVCSSPRAVGLMLSKLPKNLEERKLV